jgi:ATP phosphoribosyltransferase
MSRKIRLGIPSKGRLEEDCLNFLQDCDLKITKSNPRLYIARMATLPQVEVWFQRPTDIVRQVRDGVLDLGIAGYDTLAEHQGQADEIIVIHEALGFGGCSLEVIVPQTWIDINHIQDLADLALSRAAVKPLRVISKYERLTTRFLADHGVTAFRHLHADGALEAAPKMGTADFIVDVVQTGLTLRENHLKTLQEGQILQSDSCFFAHRATLKRDVEALAVTRQMLELFEAHLRAEGHYNLIANMRGHSAESVARKLHQYPNLAGLQGPTISPVYPKNPGQNGWYALSIMVKKARLHTAIQQLRDIGGSGVVVLPATFIFEEEPERWQRLQQTLEL